MELKYYLRGLGLGIAITAIVMGIVSSKNKTMTNEEIIARAKQLGMTENTVLDEINHKDDEQDAGVTDASTDANKTDDSGKEELDKTGGSLNVDEDVSQTDNLTSDSAKVTTDVGNSDTSQNAQAGVRKTDSGVDAEAGDSESKTGSPDAESKTDNTAANAKTDNTDANAKADNTDTNNKNDSSDTKSSETDTAALDKPMVITIGKGDGSYSVSKKLADVGAIESAGDFDTFLCENGYDKKIRTGTYTIPANASDEQMARILTGIE